MPRIARSLGFVFLLLVVGSAAGSSAAADRAAIAVGARTALAFPRCSAMHRRYPSGIARDAKSRARSVKNGHKPPLVNHTVYLANTSLDRDHDGVECEVTA